MNEPITSAGNEALNRARAAYNEAPDYAPRRLLLEKLESENAQTNASAATTAQTLDQFTRAYIECALWSSADNSDEQGGDPLDKNYDESDIAPVALASIIRDCELFQDENKGLLERAYDDGSLPVNGSGDRMGGASSAGHDFWLTRNGHGAGFLDGDWDSVANDGAQFGAALSDAAKTFGNCDLYVGDDGQLYI